VVKVGKSHEEFISLCREAVDCVDEAAIKRGLKMAAENSWDSIVAKMEEHMAGALKKKHIVERLA